MHLIIFDQVVFMAKNKEFHMLRKCFLKTFFAPNSVMILIIIAIFNCIFCGRTCYCIVRQTSV